MPKGLLTLSTTSREMPTHGNWEPTRQQKIPHAPIKTPVQPKVNILKKNEVLF